jgi:hypothetical protein
VRRFCRLEGDTESLNQSSRSRFGNPSGINDFLKSSQNIPLLSVVLFRYMRCPEEGQLS